MGGWGGASIGGLEGSKQAGLVQCRAFSPAYLPPFCPHQRKKLSIRNQALNAHLRNTRTNYCVILQMNMPSEKRGNASCNLCLIFSGPLRRLLGVCKHCWAVSFTQHHGSRLHSHQIRRCIKSRQGCA